jgi:hypothetical protein
MVPERLASPLSKNKTWAFSTTIQKTKHLGDGHMHDLGSGDHKRAPEWIDVQSHAAIDKKCSRSPPNDLSHGVAVEKTGPEKKMAPIG